MKKIINTVVFILLGYCSLFAQNVGIGTPAPSQLLHVKDGNLYVENGEILLDLFGSKLKRSGANVNLEAQANLRLNPGSVYDVAIQAEGVTYANFEGNTKRFGLGVGVIIPDELFHMKDGNFYLENGELLLDQFGSKLKRSGANVNLEAQANLRLNPGSVYDVTIQAEGVTYANFEGNTKRFGLGDGVTAPDELFHMKDGNLYVEDGEILLDQFGSKLKRSGANVNLEAQANLRLNPGTNYDVVIQSEGVTYATFEGMDQRLGIGTTTPATDLEVVGITRSDEIQIDNANTRLYNSSNTTYLANDGHLVFNAGQGSSNDGIFFQDNGSTVAKFDNGRLSIGGSFSANESFHTSGAILLGSAISSNKGTIQWDGTDFLGATNSGWKSLTSTTEMVDADGDTGINLVESAQDSINFTIDDKKYGQMHRWSDGSHYLDWYGDPTSGAFEKIQHRFFIDGTLAGFIGSTAGGLGTVEMVGDDKAVVRAAFNDGPGTHTYLATGKFFGTYGVGISVGNSLTGSLRAMLDVRGSMECDGAEINDGLTVNDGATINDVMTLTPMPQPGTATAGDVYMDDGSCGSCGGDVHLRFYNGSSWKTL